MWVDTTLAVLQKWKKAIGWTLADIRGISPAFCMHKIILEDDVKPSVEYQRRLNEAMQDVVKNEVIKWLDVGVMYPISDSSWTLPVQYVLKKGGMIVVTNAQNELIPTRTGTGWRVCMDYRKLNKVTRKDHFPLPFLDQILDRLAGRAFYCFLDGYSGYNQILIAPKDQEKTTFTCTYGTFAFSRMPFGLCNAPATFQRCMMVVFTNMVEDILEVFMDDFSVVGESFDKCLKNFDRVLAHCEETNLVLNLEKCHFIVEEDIVLGHKISKHDIEMDKAKTKFADVANFLVTGIVSCELSSNQRKKLKRDSLDFYWDEPYLFKICTDGVIRRCVPEEEQLNILEACHSYPYGGYRGGERTTSKLNELDEFRFHAYSSSSLYKDKKKYIHDKYARGKVFKVGDLVLLFNSRLRLFLEKLNLKWSGPFEVVLVTSFGALDLKNKNEEVFRVNGHRVKHYLGKIDDSHVVALIHLK
ncbi:uncharacterized protein [Nicotiana sylvestris]|uniref:uncharacterized protein n=1 Tax=Nicotiana sylvestris TaxID=4096 RepID=UPI00388C3F71